MESALVIVIMKTVSVLKFFIITVVLPSIQTHNTWTFWASLHYINIHFLPIDIYRYIYIEIDPGKKILN